VGHLELLGLEKDLLEEKILRYAVTRLLLNMHVWFDRAADTSKSANRQQIRGIANAEWATNNYRAFISEGTI
jgi:hypothetical protein